MSYAIVTDSASSLSYKIAEKLELTVLPLRYFVDEVDHPGFLKDRPVDLKGFYEAMRNGSKVRTSLPNLQESEDAIRGLLEKGKDILYLGFSCGLSGTFDAINTICSQLREQYPARRIERIETIAASYGEGLLVRGAAALAKAGSSMDEVIEWVKDRRLNVSHWITVDDLSFVLGGGRMGKRAAKVANFLNLKPILRIDEEGAIDVAGKARGRKKSLKAMVDKMKTTFDIECGKEVVIAHGDCVEDAEYLQQLIAEEISDECEFEIDYLDPVIGTHGGPGSMAIFFFGHGRK